MTEDERAGFTMLGAILKRPEIYVLSDEGKLFYPLIAFIDGIRFSISFRRNDDYLSKCLHAFEDWLIERETIEGGQQPFVVDFWPCFRARFASDREAVDGLRVAYREFLSTLPEDKG